MKVPSLLVADLLSLTFRTAWSLTYLFLHGKRAFVAKRPGPIALAGVVAAQAGLYGSYYWSEH